MRHIFFDMDLIILVLAGAAMRRQQQELSATTSPQSAHRRRRTQRTGDDESTVRMLTRLNSLVLAMVIVGISELSAVEAPVAKHRQSQLSRHRMRMVFA